MTAELAGHPDPATIAAFSLGGLDREETRACAAHLWTCADCEAVLNELAAARDLLGLVPAEAVLADPALAGPASAGPAAGLAPVGPGSRHRRRVRPGAAAALAAAAALVVGGAVTAVVTGGHPAAAPRAGVPGAASPSPGGLVITGFDATTRIGAAMTLRADGQSCGFDLRLSGLTPGTVLVIAAQRRDGRSVPAGSWTAPADAAATAFDLLGTVAVPVGDLAGFRVLTSSGSVLVTLAMP